MPMSPTERQMAELLVGTVQRVERVTSHQYADFRDLCGTVEMVAPASWVADGIGVWIRFADGRRAVFGPSQLKPAQLLRD